MSRPESTYIIDSLLQSADEWTNIQDIIKNTFATMNHVLRNHASAIRQLSEGGSGEGYAQLRQEVEELRKQVNGHKNPPGQFADQLEDKVSKGELQYLISNKVSLDELQSVSSQKASVKDLNEGLRKLNQRIEDTERNLLQRIQNMPQLHDIQYIRSQLGRSSHSEFDSNYISRAEFNKAMDEKADGVLVHKLQLLLEDKLDKISINQELLQIVDAKLEKADVYNLGMYIHELDLKLNSAIDDSAEYFQQELAQVHKENKHKLHAIERILNEKAGFADLESIKYAMEEKLDFESAKDIQSELRAELYESIANAKAEIKGEVRRQGIEYTEALGKVQGYIEELQIETRKGTTDLGKFQLMHKNELDGLRSELLKDVEGKYGKITGELGDIKGLLNKKLGPLQDAIQVNSQSLDEAHSLLSYRITRDSAQELLDQLDTTLRLYVGTIEQDLLKRLTFVETELGASLGRKVSHHELTNALGEKVDYQYLNKILSSKASVDDVKVLEYETKQLRELESNLLQTQQNLTDAKDIIDKIGKDLLLKANIKDICTLLDMKPSKLYSDIDDVNKVLNDISNELGNKADSQDLTLFKDQQEFINQAVCSEVTLGRWLWKSGRLRAGNLIPWDAQTSNTCPDNFLWDEGASSIILTAPGLYELTAGIFGTTQNSLQVLVNSEPVASQSNFTPTKKGSRLPETKSNGITGLNMIQYLALPPRARISLVGGVEGCEGFLGLRKM